jgi:hypothetical protein
MTRTREKESASRAPEEPDIAEKGLTDRTQANLLALIRLAKRFANVLFRFQGTFGLLEKTFLWGRSLITRDTKNSCSYITALCSF